MALTADRTDVAKVLADTKKHVLVNWSAQGNISPLVHRAWPRRIAALPQSGPVPRRLRRRRAEGARPRPGGHLVRRPAVCRGDPPRADRRDVRSPRAARWIPPGPARALRQVRDR